MSLPEFPKDTSLTRQEAINQIISSIAMEELGLSHIINAEGEKLQYVLGTIPGISGPAATIEDVLKVNESVRAVLQSAAESQSLLRSKLQNALSSAVMTGPTGPSGPSGPANGLNAFAGIYNRAAADTAMTANTPVVVPLPSTTTSRNTSYTTPNSITVQEAGTYYLSYSMAADFSEPTATLAFAVRSNGANIPLTEDAAGASDTPLYFAGDAIVDLPAGAVIDMAVTSDVAQTMSFGDETKSTLYLFKLN